jgi:hypothetical protein
MHLKIMTNSKKTRNLLLLTATIMPKLGVPNLSRIDPSIRLRDYQDALKFYLSTIDNGPDGIIFAENSNSDISDLIKLAKAHNKDKEVEFISFDGLDYPPSYDRGFGEFKLIDYAMENSKLIRSCSEQRTVIWKCTGRYKIRNISSLIRRQPGSFDIYCNCRNVPKRWVDTYLIAWTPETYQLVLRGIYHKLKLNVPGIPAKVAAEEILRGHLDLWLRDINIIQRLKETPDIEGVRAADNKGYSSDNLWKFRLRKSASKIFPWLWV